MTTTARTLTEYRAQPLGGVVSGPSVLAWWSSVGIRFLYVRAPLPPADVRLILDIMIVDIAACAPKHASLVDVRELREVPMTLAQIPTWCAQHHDELAEKISRSAVVYSDVASAAVVAGHHRVARVPYETLEFTDGEAALAWLGCDGATEVWAQWNELIAAHRDELQRRLQQYFSEHLARATIEHCAKTLGLAPRSLQRQLRESGLSFRERLSQLRFHRAEQLVREGTKITAVAEEIGFSKTEHLNALFVAHTGMTALAWREQQQGKP